MDQKTENNDILLTSAQMSGDGTQNNPFLISDINGLNSIRNNLSAYYRLTADLDLEGETIIPIGTSAAPFTGGFDGDGHTIRHLVIQGTDSNTGLFGYVKYARLENLNIVGGHITSPGYYTGTLAGSMEDSSARNILLSDITVVSNGNVVGALAGYVYYGLCSRCCLLKNSSVTGRSNVGGLIGGTNGSTNISECGAEGTVTGRSVVGGLLGGATGSITNCYARGSVNSLDGAIETGGLIGYGSSSLSVTNCYAACRVSKNGSGLIYQADKTVKVTGSYFDSQLSEIEVNDSCNKGKLTTAMLRMETYTGWAFGSAWRIMYGGTYPCLYAAGEEESGAVDTGGVPGGAGTQKNPYLIESIEGFRCIKYDLSGFYRLTADLDFEGEEVTPVGTSAIPFTGGFDGDGHTIRHLVIQDDGYTGLFGYASSAKFRNIIMANADIASSGNYAGALAGYLYACNTENILLTGITLSGVQYNGSLAGYTYTGNFTRCFSKRMSISGTSFTGGLIGYAQGSVVIKECSAEGTVTGTSYVGGLVGYGSGTVSNCCAKGIVTSGDGSIYTAGLIGNAPYLTLDRCYAACQISENGSGLVNVNGNSATVTVSYFDSSLSGITTPEEQARTTEQMANKNTYSGWNWVNTWSDKETGLPELKGMKCMSQASFDLLFYNLGSDSVTVKWPNLEGIDEYTVNYMNIQKKQNASEIMIEGLTPDTDYEFRVRADFGNSIVIWSRTLKIRTKKPELKGLHCSIKDNTSVTLSWNPLDHVRSYEVFYNGNIQITDTSTCTLTDLYSDIPYTIYVRALLTDGTTVTGKPIVEKIYTVSPQTEYARQFVEKCGQQTWFMDEIENLLNLKGKSINTINSQRDFTAIYAIDLTGRGISGELPVAIGELEQLRYLYLADNDLGGRLPEELAQLDRLLETDLSGNHFSE